MRTSRIFHAVDSHTEGMPTRVITGGVGTIPGATMAERRLWFMENTTDPDPPDERTARPRVDERGDPPATDPAGRGLRRAVHRGVRLLPMCGHGTIGVATVLVETGMVEVTEPVTTIRLDTPAGLVVAEVAVKDGARRVRDHAQRAVVRRSALDQQGGSARVRPVSLRPGVRRQLLRHRGPGHLGLPFDRAAQGRPAQRRAGDHGRDQRAGRTGPPGAPRHPRLPPRVSQGPGLDAQHSRHAMAIHPGWFDRSPCGTGTSARMAQLHARGELALDKEFVNESFIGSRFIGRLVEETRRSAGRPAVIPTITGRAWVTGTAQYMLDPDDPFPAGFLL